MCERPKDEYKKRISTFISLYLQLDMLNYTENNILYQTVQFFKWANVLEHKWQVFLVTQV